MTRTFWIIISIFMIDTTLLGVFLFAGRPEWVVFVMVIFGTFKFAYACAALVGLVSIRRERRRWLS